MGNKNKLPGVFTPEQLVRLMDSIDNIKVAMAVGVAFFGGLRISEVCNIEIADVDLNNRVIKIRDSKNPNRAKTGYGKDRLVEYLDQIHDPMVKWIKLIEGGKWLFPSDKSPDLPLRKKSLYEQYRVYLRRAGLERPREHITYETTVNGKKVERTVTRHEYNFHTLRHSVATWMRNRGVPLDVIKEFLGHERFDTTFKYAKLASQRRRNVIREHMNTPLRNTYVPQEEVRRVTAQQPNQSPLDFLGMMYARGEISDEEFERKKRNLQGITQPQIQVAPPLISADIVRQ